MFNHALALLCLSWSKLQTEKYKLTVLLLTDPVTLPPCRLIKSSASSLSITQSEAQTQSYKKYEAANDRNSNNTTVLSTFYLNTTPKDWEEDPDDVVSRRRRRRRSDLGLWRVHGHLRAHLHGSIRFHWAPLLRLSLLKIGPSIVARSCSFSKVPHHRLLPNMKPKTWVIEIK